MDDIQIHNIPAYQRKRSLSAKARKKTKIPKYTNTNKIKAREREIQSFTEIPILNKMPSQELFPGSSPPLKDKNIIEMKICGRCDGYFDKINVAIIQVTSPIRKNDIIILEKEDGLFQQPIQSMQINRKDVSLARSGSDIGIKVAMKPKVGTPVYKIV